MTIRSLLLPLLLVPTLFSSTACMGWRTDELDGPRTLERWRTPLRVTYDLEVIGFEGGVTTEPRSEGVFSVNEWAQVDEVLGELGVDVASLGDDAGIGGEPGDVHLDLSLRYGGSRSKFMSFLCGLTVTVIPAYATDTTTLEAVVTGADGRSATYSAEGGVFTLIWLPTILVTPFLNPLTDIKELQRELVCSVWMQAAADGLVPGE